MNEPKQELEMHFRFQVKMSPDNREHLINVAKGYFTSKGIKFYQGGDKLIIE